MKRMMIATLVLALGALSARADTGMYGGPADGIVWEKSTEAAAAKAKESGKAVLVMHLLGKLDEEFC